MTEPDKHDWPQIIRELEILKITPYKLASMLGQQYGQVVRWRDSHVEPRHSDGERLLAIHREYVNVGQASAD